MKNGEFDNFKVNYPAVSPIEFPAMSVVHHWYRSTLFRQQKFVPNWGDGKNVLFCFNYKDSMLVAKKSH